jgi:hypothetical protein
MPLIQLNDSHETFLSTDEGDSERSSSTTPVVASSSNSTEKKLPKWTSWIVRYQGGGDKRRVFPSRRRSFRKNSGRKSSKSLSPRALEVLESHQDGGNDEPRFVTVGTGSKKCTATLDADINEEDDVRSNSSVSVEPDSALELSVLPHILNAASLASFEQGESAERNSEHLFVIQEEDATSDDFAASGRLPEPAALHMVSVVAPSIPVESTTPTEKPPHSMSSVDVEGVKCSATEIVSTKSNQSSIRKTAAYGKAIVGTQEVDKTPHSDVPLMPASVDTIPDNFNHHDEACAMHLSPRLQTSPLGLNAARRRLPEALALSTLAPNVGQQSLHHGPDSPTLLQENTSLKVLSAGLECPWSTFPV